MVEKRQYRYNKVGIFINPNTKELKVRIGLLKTFGVLKYFTNVIWGIPIGIILRLSYLYRQALCRKVLTCQAYSISGLHNCDIVGVDIYTLYNSEDEVLRIIVGHTKTQPVCLLEYVVITNGMADAYSFGYGFEDAPSTVIIPSSDSYVYDKDVPTYAIYRSYTHKSFYKVGKPDVYKIKEVVYEKQ